MAKLNRPRTVPDLLAGRRVPGVSSPEVKPAKLTKLLLNVTVQRSLGAVMVIMSPESTVGDLIAAVLRQYVKEGRRPILGSTECGGFDLHYSQFSLESKFSHAILLHLNFSKLKYLIKEVILYIYDFFVLEKRFNSLESKNLV